MTKEEMLSAIYDEMGILQEIYSPSWTMYHRIPVRIGDVLWYINENFDMKTKPSYAMIVLWALHNKFSFHRWTIDEQSDECIEFVYNLINK